MSYARQQFLNRLKSDPATYTYFRERGDVINEVRQKLLDDIKEGKKPLIVRGIFSPEEENSDGIVEEIIRPDKGWTFLKIYGCKYLYKGNAPANVVWFLQFPKHVLSQIPRDIIGKSFLYSGAVILRFLFQRKKFIKDLESLFYEIYWKVIRHCRIEDKEYNELE